MPAWRYRIAGRAMRWWWKLRRPRTFGARAVLVDRAGRVALVRHHYIDGWYLPGGGVAKRESAATAIRRELREEVGLGDVRLVRVLGVYHNTAQSKDDHVVVFTAETDTPEALIAADRREIAEVAWAAVEALPDDTSPATRRRIAEYRAGEQGFGAW
ncbi:NUDIX domain-containing protein [Sphingomonas sp. TZW2008]|uniref:NUDIX domain-containing protein n=1 Tax=Sphingomonas sp. TZW2008 TaxID=1917973 RepID=UPI002119CD0F|nr:NUDIX domain-containing protein [Sphingomonas sp. TZW2008]